jgi:molybdopterin-guanine dinucleotide biosynthesis protein A
VIAAIVLAAGASTRFGSPKQAVLLEPVVQRVRESREIADGRRRARRARGRDVAPRRPLPGVGARAGRVAPLRPRALGDDVEAAVVVLGDGPRIDPAAIDRSCGLAATAPGRVAATYGGVACIRCCWLVARGTRSRTRARARCRPRWSPATTSSPPGDVDFADHSMEGWPFEGAE